MTDAETVKFRASITLNEVSYETRVTGLNEVRIVRDGVLVGRGAWTGLGVTDCDARLVALLRDGAPDLEAEETAWGQIDAALRAAQGIRAEQIDGVWTACRARSDGTIRHHHPR